MPARLPNLLDTWHRFMSNLHTLQLSQPVGATYSTARILSFPLSKAQAFSLLLLGLSTTTSVLGATTATSAVLIHHSDTHFLLGIDLSHGSRSDSRVLCKTPTGGREGKGTNPRAASWSADSRDGSCRGGTRVKLNFFKGSELHFERAFIEHSVRTVHSLSMSNGHHVIKSLTHSHVSFVVFLSFCIRQCMPNWSPS